MQTSIGRWRVFGLATFQTTHIVREVEEATESGDPGVSDTAVMDDTPRPKVCVCAFAVLRVLLGAFARFGSQLDACVSDSQLDAFFLPALFSFRVFEIFRQRNSASVTNAAGNT